MKLKNFLKEAYNIALLCVDIPISLVQFGYQGFKEVSYSHQEYARMQNGINPNKIKIIEKLEKLNLEEEFTALVYYQPIRDLGVMEAPEQIQITYNNKRYILSGDSFNNIQTFLLEKEGYEIEFNHQYDAKEFLENAKAIKIYELPQFVQTHMKQLDGENDVTFEERMNKMYDFLDIEFNLTIFREQELFSDILPDIEVISVKPKNVYKI